jgi:hypothetical protein
MSSVSIIYNLYVNARPYFNLSPSPHEMSERLRQLMLFTATICVSVNFEKANGRLSDLSKPVRLMMQFKIEILVRVSETREY